MEASIKRFTQRLSYLNLVLLSTLAASLSVKFSFLKPTQQFVAVSTVIIAELTVAAYLSRQRIDLNRALALITVILTVLFSFNRYIEVLAAFSIITVLITPFKLSQYSFEVLEGFLMHLADATSTILIIKGYKGEANPLMRRLIFEIGVFPAIILSKTMFVGLPLLYSVKMFDELEKIFFARVVFILGAAMAIRNLILFL